MLNKIKKKYNKWLFKKHGFNRGALFENVIFKHKNSIIFVLLFSPSLYSYYEGQEMVKGLREGLESEIEVE